jgi:hypothetical protein
MGGWASGQAAMAMPDGYRSMILVGSSTGSFGVQDGTPEWPRNLAVIWGVWDEFSNMMWGSPVPGEIGRTEKLRALFGTEADVVTGALYGSVEDGTARRLYIPRTNHPGAHHSTEAIGNAVEWFQTTLEGGNDLPPSDQIWYWKEVGNLISTAGMVLLLFPVGILLLQSGYFSELRRASAPSRGEEGTGWWVAAAITALLGPLTLFYFRGLPARLGWQPGPLFPQDITNSVIAWTTALGVITLALLLIWHFAVNRKAGPVGDAYGLTWGGELRPARIGKSLLLAFLVVLAGYAALLATANLFTTDFRFWVFAIKPMSPLHLRMALVYFLPLAFYFLALNLVLFGQLRRDGWSGARTTGANLAVLVLGWIGFYAVQYAPLLSGGTLATPDEPLWTIISYQLLPLMIISGLVLSFFNRRTGSVYPGAFATAMLVTWIVVASQATHVAL